MTLHVNEREEAWSINSDEVRLARWKARKTAKRQKVKMRLAKRREEENKTEEGRRQAADAVCGRRRQHADDAMAERAERKRNKCPESEQSLESRPEALARRTSSNTPVTADETIEYVGADDGLPTAMMHVESVRRQVKLDSGARLTIAGTDWMANGDKVEMKASVDYVEGIGGFLLDVIGVWRFHLCTVFGETITADACIVSGCTDEFLLGVDFMRTKGATMDFDRNEMRYHENGRAMVVPFRTHDETNGAKIAAA
ncbi:hypothetical protein PInf_016981 [Phytophthora infestans]|nr:hypothetical protein PInf_016981 [Phytophthora infestans]